MTFRNRIKKLFRRKERNQFRESLEHIISDKADGEKAPLEEAEKELIKNLLELRELTAQDVMVPRSEIEAIRLETTLKEAVEFLKKRSFSRYPVYHENLDDLRGFVHIKDVAKHVLIKDFDLRKSLNKINFVPASIPVIDLLVKMRHDKTPLVAVVDEYGGTDGIVTAWDIMTRVLGELQKEPEHELDDQEITYIADDMIEVDGRCLLESIPESFQLELTEEEEEEGIDTINGLILFLAGRVPSRKEIIRHSCGIEFEVLEASPRAVLRVRLLKGNDEHA